ncbi:predicted protein [Naegleria gruberi]|uniref:Predicted protein n=1 Tax=Naegleria gruberi TaxID=5762 RepID=D2V181_NAEGR|nr:uncharacterized protein NAEGRDRAFT_62791 [Naegleria gruberi]EFC49422.1 predicted protein [Naegleria gruberi]|eukprot:XP_002682166.1 predicted protein [Naegleria gruberi strain NEG-M]
MSKKDYEGMKGISPILKQDWNPNPSIICCYDSMHVLYEGLFQDFMSLIPESYWEKFDKIFLKQKYPSFLHKHPRKITNGKTMNKLRAIEVYMICHYFLEIFNHIGEISSILVYVEMITELTRIVDHLTDSFQLETLDFLEIQLLDLLYKYQNIVGEKKATPNFHIVSDLIQSCKMYGPLAHNSAFIGEGLNFTLSKTYVCSNSARYSIMYFDMCQLCDILDLGEDLSKGQCIFGNYVISKKRDFITNIKSGRVFQIDSFSEDYNTITLKSVKSDTLLVVERKDIDKYLPCVQLSLPKKEIYTTVHKNTFQYL